MRNFFSSLIFGILLFLSFQATAWANWLPLTTPCTQYNATTLNSGTLTVPKLEGVFQYCVKQEILENPYSGGTINFDGVNYTFISSTGASTFLGPTVPNQAQFLGEYTVKSKIYRFDKTGPISCSSSVGVLYYGLPYSTGTLVPYLGGWTNKDVFGRIICTDSQPASYIVTDTGMIISDISPYTIIAGSGVYKDADFMTGYTLVTPTAAETSQCLKENYENIGVHNSSGVLLTLQDNAGNGVTEYCYYNHLIMKDAYSPRISVHDINGTLLEDISNINYSTGEIIAEESTAFSVEVRDVPDLGSAVSGIKNYKASVTYIADHKGVAVPPLVVCDLPLTALPPPPVDPLGEYDDDAIENFTITCDTDPALQKTGIYKLEVTTQDIAGNFRTFTALIKVYPNPVINVIPIVPSAPPAPVNSDGNALHTYEALLLDKFSNPVFDFPVGNILYKGTANTFLDEVAKTGDPLVIKDPNSSKTDMDGILHVGVASVAPGDLTNAFDFSLRTWTDVDDYKDNTGIDVRTYTFGDFSDKRIFTRPYSGILSLLPVNIILGYSHSGIIDVVPASYAPGAYTVNNFTNSLGTMDANMTLSYRSIISDTGAFFTPEQIGGNILDFRITAHPYAEYIMKGVNIKSYITPNPADPEGAKIISGNTGAVNRIYIIGNKQTIGKEGYVTTQSDISKMTVVDIRNAIRKNANIAVRLRTPDTAATATPKIINGIKYIEGDYTITDAEANSRDWETLIVIDGNVIFQTDKFNATEDKAAIIVLKSDLNNSKGNIFIKPNVVYISSLLYVDGSIESVDTNGDEFTSMSSVRSNMLNKQLVLKGVFISRNTIGGAVLGSGSSGSGGKKYTLPGNIGTDDLVEAVKYDLSFLRSSNVGFDQPSGTAPYNFGNNAFVVVIYNSDYMISTPPGFSMNP